MTRTCSPKSRSRKLWDNHGSWLILIFVVGVAFNGGQEWHSYKTQNIVEAIITSGRAERDDLQARLRAVNDENRALARQLGPAVQQATTASQEAGKAVEKADRTIEKAKQIIEANK